MPTPTSSMECEVCGAPASVAWETTAVGEDFGPPNDALFSIQRIQCAAGHWYTHTELIVKVETDWWEIPDRCWGDTPVCATESVDQPGYCICRTDMTQERNHDAGTSKG